MAAPLFPDDFGGDRAVADDPDRADVATALGDMVRLNLRLIHALNEAGGIPAAQRGLFDNITDGLRNTARNADATKARETNTRVPRSLTRVPDAPFGDNNNYAQIRMTNVPTFDGASKDPAEVTRWLRKVLTVAQANNLSFAATIRLLSQASAKAVGDSIDDMREEGRTLAEIVQQLELRYGDLRSKEDALYECHSMERRENEELSDFIDRLRYMARVAFRFENGDEERRLQVDKAVESNIRRVLPTSVRNALEERIVNRSRTGLPAFTSRELEKECIDLERKRSDRRKLALKLAASQPKKGAARYVHAAQADLSEPELSSPDESEDEEEEPTTFLINQIQRERQKYIARNIPVDQKKVYKGAFRKYNERYNSKAVNSRPGRPRVVAEVVQQSGHKPQIVASPPQKPPSDTLGNKNVYELLELANCEKGHCIQCGLKGHLMRRDECPLKGKNLVSSPCAKCGRGLHSADDCVMTFMKQANQAQDDSLNDE